MAVPTRGRAGSRVDRWVYDAVRPGLGEEFLAELERVYEHIGAHPNLYQEVLPGIRRGILRRFPYHVYYVPAGPDIVHVIAVVHHARHERAWKKRL